MNDKLRDVSKLNQWDLEDVNKSLKSDAQLMIRRMQDLIERLDGDFHINELGECQSLALKIDRNCAVRQERIKTMKMLQSIAKDEVQS